MNNHLSNTGGVTQIEERDTAVVTATSNPTSKRHGLPHERGVEGTGVMSTEHGDEILSAVHLAIRSLVTVLGDVHAGVGRLSTEKPSRQ